MSSQTVFTLTINSKKNKRDWLCKIDITRFIIKQTIVICIFLYLKHFTFIDIFYQSRISKTVSKFINAYFLDWGSTHYLTLLTNLFLHSASSTLIISMSMNSACSFWFPKILVAFRQIVGVLGVLVQWGRQAVAICRPIRRNISRLVFEQPIVPVTQQERC